MQFVLDHIKMQQDCIKNKPHLTERITSALVSVFTTLPGGIQSACGGGFAFQPKGKQSEITKLPKGTQNQAPSKIGVGSPFLVVPQTINWPYRVIHPVR